MKIITAFAIVTATMALAGQPAHARGPRRPMRNQNPACEAMHAAKQDAILKKYDANKDGQLDREERIEHHEDKRKAALQKYDGNKNIRLDKQERDKLRADKATEWMGTFDTDKNGQISKAESEKACGPVARHFDKVDADGNGAVTKQEFATAVAQHRDHKGRGHRGRPGRQGVDGGPGPDVQ